MGTEDNMNKVWFSNPDFCPAPDRLKWESRHHLPWPVLWVVFSFS